MNKTEVMKELESLGKVSHLKTYARHGIPVTNAFGVPYADLYKIQKRIGADQPLAEQLWETGNHDARTLAAFIADPAVMKVSALEAWAKTADNSLSVDAIAGLAAKTSHAPQLMHKWMKAKSEWLAAAGWHLLSTLVSRPGLEPPSEDECSALLDRIEAEIHRAANRVRYEMNGAVIAISGRSEALKKKAIAVAKRIGKVEVDHGDTSCKTPDAVTYIEKMAAHRSKKKTGSKKVAAKKAPAKKNAAPKKAIAKKAIAKKAKKT